MMRAKTTGGSPMIHCLPQNAFCQPNKQNPQKVKNLQLSLCMGPAPTGLAGKPVNGTTTELHQPEEQTESPCSTHATAAQLALCSPAAPPHTHSNNEDEEPKQW